MGAAAPVQPAPRQRIGVAVSGGLDSTALWHATARLAATVPSLEVVGLHVHHGLQAEADAWLSHLRRQARRWAARGLPVSLQWRQLSGAPGRGDSVEAWARRGRYAGLAEMAHEHDIDVVLLAHHRRDQAETFLLQALRGAGPAGLAAMPRQRRRQNILWVRPWLEQPREAIEAYVRRHRLRVVDDPSNGDARYARSRLRQAVWPTLREAFAGADERLAASASRAQEAAACLHELAEADQRIVCAADGRLRRDAWLTLSAARRANVLRACLSGWTGQGAAQTLVDRLLVELPLAQAARWPLGRGELRLHRGQLEYSDGVARPDAVAHGPMRIDLSRIGHVAVPEWHGAFEVTAVASGGVSALQLRDCELRDRIGGERFQRAPHALPRCLKKQYQSAGVPRWARSGPLVYAAGELLYVPVLGMDARRAARAGAPMLGLCWVADGAADGDAPRQIDA